MVDYNLLSELPDFDSDVDVAVIDALGDAADSLDQLIKAVEDACTASEGCNAFSECVAACIDAHGASYVLTDGATTYGLGDQKAPAAFAARKVSVTGVLDPTTKTIAVTSIVAAN